MTLPQRHQCFLMDLLATGEPTVDHISHIDNCNCTIINGAATGELMGRRGTAFATRSSPAVPVQTSVRNLSICSLEEDQNVTFMRLYSRHEPVFNARGSSPAEEWKRKQIQTGHETYSNHLLRIDPVDKLSSLQL